jgi:hypothetical protein
VINVVSAKSVAEAEPNLKYSVLDGLKRVRQILARPQLSYTFHSPCFSHMQLSQFPIFESVSTTLFIVAVAGTSAGWTKDKKDGMYISMYISINHYYNLLFSCSSHFSHVHFISPAPILSHLLPQSSSSTPV